MKIAVYCGANSGADPAFLQAASKVGAWIAARGDTLIYGGGKLGLMGAVAQSALDHGGDVIGIMPQVLADRGLAMPALTHLRHQYVHCQLSSLGGSAISLKKQLT